MRYTSCLVLLYFAWAQATSAQELLSVRVEPAVVAAGKPAQIVVDMKPSTVNNGACGLLVSFGDGTSQPFRAENNSLPVRLNHTYSISGTVTVTAEGKLYARGLNSVLGCFGNNQSFAMVVEPENLSDREALEMAAKAEALKRAATERRAAEALANAAARDRAAGEASAQQARTDRAAAEAAARKTAEARAQAERSAARAAQPAATAPSPPFKSVAPAAPKGAAPPAQPVKPPPPKPKSSLDL